MTAFLLVLLTLLQAGDIVTTLMILKLGGRELNPIVRWLLGRFADTPALIAAKLLVTIPLAYLILTYPALRWVAAVGCAIIAAVLVSNVRVLRRLKGKKRTAR